jgi:subtilisin family serine protease
MKNIETVAFALLLLASVCIAQESPLLEEGQPYWNATPVYAGPSGYLIQFMEAPASVHIGTFPTQPSQFDEAKNYANWLKAAHSGYLSQIENAVPGFSGRQRYDLVLVQNGIMVKEISPAEKAKIEKLSFVKKIYELGHAWPAMPNVTVTLGAVDMWAGGYTGAGVRVGVVDTGVDATHPDFAVPGCTANGSVGPGCRVEWAYDFVYDHDLPQPSYWGHGTHVAGIVAANFTNESGALFRGMAPDATIYDYKVCDLDHFHIEPAPANSCPEISILNAFERILDPNNDSNMEDHVDIATMSIGALDNDPDSIVSLSSDNMVNVGVVAVAAVHNYGYGGGGAYAQYGYVASPAASRKTIGVGASFKFGTLAGFSSRGPVLGGAVKPDVLAIGAMVCSTFWTGHENRSCYGFPGHISYSGTSMATPAAAGAAALLVQQHPEWNPDEIKYALRNTANANVTKSIDGVRFQANVLDKGHGRINAFAAGGSPRPAIVELRKESESRQAVRFEANLNAYANEAAGEYNYTYDVGFMGQNPREDGPILEDPESWLGAYHEQGSVQLAAGMPAQLQFAQIEKVALFPQNGLYLVKLNVSGNGRETIDYFTFVVDNPAVLTPFNGDVYRDSLEINGTVLLPENYTYTVWYAPNGTGGWSAEGITLENGGLQSADGRIARFDAPAGLQSGFYQFRLGMYDQNGGGPSVEQVFAILRIDRGIAQNYPAYIEIPVPRYDHRWSYRSEAYEYELDSYYIMPTLKDVDGDGQKEIAYVENLPDRSTSAVYAIGSDGVSESLVISPPEAEGEVNRLSLHLNDFDLDGENEYSYAKYKAAHYHSVFAQQQDESEFWSLYSNETQPPAWYHYYRMEYQLNNYQVLADLDHDGEKELVFVLPGNLNAAIYVVWANGSVMSGWPQNVTHMVSGQPSQPSPMVGNFDSDPQLEIAYTGMSECFYAENCSMPLGKAYMFELDGSVMPGWPVYYNTSGYPLISTPVAVDLGGDGIDELLVAGGNALRAFGSSGTVAMSVLNGSTFVSSPAVADVDWDGAPDIAVEDNSGLVHLLYADGTEHPGWPVQNQHAYAAGSSWRSGLSVYEPLFGDIDGNGQLDLVYEGREIVSGVPFNTIHARNLAGQELAGFPKYVESSILEGLNLADMNNDGTLELVGTGEGRQRLSWFDNIRIGTNHSDSTVPRQTAYVWHLGAQASQINNAWPTQHRDEGRTNRYVGRLGAPYSFDALGTMEGNISVSWAEADNYPLLAGYAVQLANDSGFGQMVADVNVSLSTRDYTFTNVGEGAYYARAGSRSMNGSYAWAAPAMVGSGALSVGDPYGGDVYGDLMSVDGSAYIPQGFGLFVEYAPVGTEEWSIEGVEIAPSAGPNRTHIADFNAPAGFAPEFYKFRIRVVANDGRELLSQEIATVRIDTGLAQGFPARVPSVARDYPIPMIRNVDADAEKEIIFASRNELDTASVVYVVGADGELEAIVESEPDTNQNLNRLSLQVADIGNDGVQDAVYSSGGNAEGTPYYTSAYSLSGQQGWQESLPDGGRAEQYGTFTVLSDIDRNGQKELVFVAPSGEHMRSIYVKSLAGVTRNGWPTETADCGPRDGVQPSPIVANLDADSDLEVVYAAEGDNCDVPSGKAVAFNPNGSPVPGWPVLFDSPARASSASADLDDDGKDEVIIPTRNGLYAYRPNGELIWHALEGQWAEAPALADLDFDGGLEIVVSVTGTQHGIRVLNEQGQLVGSWDTNLAWDDRMGPVLADADGDGSLDIIHEDVENVSGTVFGMLRARDIEGNDAVAPKYVELTVLGSHGKAIADIDGDGMLELVSGSEGANRYGTGEDVATRQSVYAWSLGGNAGPRSRVWPTLGRNFERTGRQITRMSAPYGFNAVVSGNSITVSFVEADDYMFLSGYALQESMSQDFANSPIQEVPAPGNYVIGGLANGWHYVRAASVNSFAMPPDQRYAWTAAKRVCIGGIANCPATPIDVVGIGNRRRIDWNSQIVNSIGAIGPGVSINNSTEVGINAIEGIVADAGNIITEEG